MTQVRKNVLMLGFLALLAGGAGLYAYFGVLKADEAEEKRKDEEARLVPLGSVDAADGGQGALDFTRIVVRAKGETTTLERQGETWRIVAPVKAKVDSFALDGLKSQLQTGRFKDTVEESPTAEDLKRYGLDEPRFTVTATVRGAGGAEREITIHGGIENTFDGSIYVRREGDPRVYAVQGGVKWNLEKSTYDLRDKEVLGVPEKEVTRIEVSDPGGRRGFVAVRGEDKAWRLERPEALRADAQAITTFLGGLRHHRAETFLTDSPDTQARFRFEAPVATAVFTLESGGSVRLDFGRTEKDGVATLAVRRTGDGDTTLAVVPGAALGALFKDPMELRDRAVLTFDKEQVARIAFEKADGARIVVERVRSDAGHTEDWRVVSPEQGPAKKWKLSSILWSLGSLKAKAFGEEAPKSWAKWGLDKPEQTVSLYAADGRELATLAVGRAVEGEENTRFVRGSRNQVLQMEIGRLSDLPASLEDVLDRPAPPVGDGDSRSDGGH